MGQGADAVVLVEADSALCRAHRLLVTPEGCRAVAAVIRGWVGEDARQLWDRLRAEPVPEGEAEAVGAWCVANEWTIGQFVSVADGKLRARGGFNTVHALGGSTQQRDPCGPDKIAARTTAIAALRWPPVQIIEVDAAGLNPRDVAAWLYLNARSFGVKGPEHGFDAHDDHERDPDLAKFSISWPPTIISNADVSTVEPGILPAGTVAYIDPPYQNTTGYGHVLPREQVLTIARRWADAGALVCVSEAVPLPLDGWHHVEITGCRVGQKRTFGPTKEWLTLNRAPAWTPPVQGTLW